MVDPWMLWCGLNHKYKHFTTFPFPTLWCWPRDLETLFKLWKMEYFTIIVTFVMMGIFSSRLHLNYF